jgi:hypothetical protein
MVERRRCLRFTDKSFAVVFGLESLGLEELQRDKPVEFGVFRFVNHTHTTLPEFFENLVV